MRKTINVADTNMCSAHQVFTPVTAIAQIFYGAFSKNIPAICPLLTQVDQRTWSCEKSKGITFAVKKTKLKTFNYEESTKN